MISRSRKQGVIFDLDGTLLDTLTDLAEAMNVVLAGQGWRTHPVDAYRRFVGDGVAMLVRRALPEKYQDEAVGEAVIEECVQSMRAEYAKRWARTTKPYAGVEELLGRLESRSIPMAVFSNKPHEATREMVLHFFPEVPFHVIAGAKADKPRKPDPGVALNIGESMGVVPGDMLFLGDSDIDMQTAQAAGMVPLGAAWGFRGRDELLASGAACVLATPLELMHWLRP